MASAATAARRAGAAVSTAGLSGIRHRPRVESVRSGRKPLDARILERYSGGFGRVFWSTFLSDSPHFFLHTKSTFSSRFLLAFPLALDREEKPPLFSLSIAALKKAAVNCTELVLLSFTTAKECSRAQQCSEDRAASSSSLGHRRRRRQCGQLLGTLLNCAFFAPIGISKARRDRVVCVCGRFFANDGANVEQMRG